MGGGASIELHLAARQKPPILFERDLQKELPLDASDIDTVEQARAEVSRLRRLGKWMLERAVRLDPPHVFYGFEMPEFPSPQYTSCMSEILGGPSGRDIWDELCEQVTPQFGVTLDKCIRTGVENPSHPAIKTVGLVAGDEDCYSTFAALFDPVIALRHGLDESASVHPASDFDVAKVPAVPIPVGYVESTRLRVCRNFQGIPFPPSCNFQERMKAERVATSALESLQGEFGGGDYFPLHGSDTYGAKQGGMSPEQELEFRCDRHLFQPPTSPLLLASHMERDWPHGRGIFCTPNKLLVGLINEEDALRLVCMDNGADARAILGRLGRAVQEVEKHVVAQGFSFCHSSVRGYLATCPSNIGTTLRASMLVRLPLLSARSDFRDLCALYRLQVRGARGVDDHTSKAVDSEGAAAVAAGASEAKSSSTDLSGLVDVSNVERVGWTEAQLVTVLLAGVAWLVDMEKTIEQEKELPRPCEINGSQADLASVPATRLSVGTIITLARRRAEGAMPSTARSNKATEPETDEIAALSKNDEHIGVEADAKINSDGETLAAATS